MKTIIVSLALLMVTVNGHPHPQASGSVEGNKYIFSKYNTYFLNLSYIGPLKWLLQPTMKLYVNSYFIFLKTLTL